MSKEYRKTYHTTSKSKEYHKRYRLAHKEKLEGLIKDWFIENKEENFLYRKEQSKKRKLANPEKGRQYSKKYGIEHREESRIYESNRYHSDPLYRMSKALRNRLRQALKSKSWHTDSHFREYIGCELPVLITHIQKQFVEGMSWDNHGKWHLDHIIPLNSAKSVKELIKLCHYTNIQPLWAQDNLRKQDK